MNPNLTVRPSGVCDLQIVNKLLRIIADIHREGRPDVFEGLVSKYTSKEVEERLSSPDNGIFIAELNGISVGYIFCDIIKEGKGLTLYIDDLCVEPSARGNGVATALMDYAASYGKAKGCRYLMLNVWEFNSSALAFYEKYGFQTRSRHLEKTI